MAGGVHPALGAITGEPLEADGGVARLTEVFLGAVSVTVFGTLAGTLGAYFLRSDERVAATSAP